LHRQETQEKVKRCTENDTFFGAAFWFTLTRDTTNLTAQKPIYYQNQ